MPDLVLHGLPVSYTTVGDGFPLLLMPGPDGTATVWDQHVPLLSELCRVITYVVPATPLQDMVLLQALLASLAVERCYLACHAPAWPLALQYARQQAPRLEGLVLLGTDATALPPTLDPAVELSAASLHTITVPVLVLLAEQYVALLPQAEVLNTHLPRSTRVVLSHTDPGTSLATASRLCGHAMMRFLLHCERQRNLVRGASFLL